MNQQRLRAYIALIQKLLACPSGEEWILLRQNEALVTPELVQVMEQVATQLVNQGDLKEAKFLHNLAGQIHHLFVAKTVQHSGNEDYSQVYLELIQALLDCPQGSERELLEANQELVGPGLVQMMQQVAAQLVAKGDQETANYLQHWATELNRLWLQEHDFQPVRKPEAEPKHANNGSVAPSSIPTQNPSPQPIPPVLQPDRPLSAKAEDFWAEPSEQSEHAGLEQADLKQVDQTYPQPSSPPKSPTVESTTPQPCQNGAVAPPLGLASYEPIAYHLQTVAAALTRLSEALALTPPSPADPLWYMEILERACTGHWILTSIEIQKLIGVQPTCSKGGESFQRGCWIFVKAGKVGTQTGWRVQKEVRQEVQKEEESTEVRSSS